MRKCRKMISVIMLTVMLATLTPFQALAADIPTNGTDETITTVTEPQNEGQEGQKGQEDQTGQGTEDQGTGSDEGKGIDASGDNTQNSTDAGDQTPSGNEGTDSQTVGQDPVNNGDENTQTDGQNTTDPNASDPNATDPNATGSDPVEKGGNRAVAAEDLTITAKTTADEYAYKDEVTLSATAESENADFNPENVTWQWQKRNENADDESAWTDIDGANESSYSFTYDETNWDQVYRAVATYEEVEKASDTVTITPKHSDEYVIDSSRETTRIKMDTEYNILDDVTVSPEYDAVTRLPVKVRIKSVECKNDTPDLFDSSRDFTQPDTLRAYKNDGQGHTRAQAKYTVIYEAYVEDNDGNITVLTPTSGETVEFETFDDSLVGPDSTGLDVAFIKNLEITEVVDGSPDIVTEGDSVGEWDAEDGPGYDTGPHNGVVRTFDTVTYDLTFQSETYPYGDYRVYKKGRVGFEFMIPGTDKEIMFNEDSMAWLKSTDANYKIIENVDADGKTWQVMRGDFMWESADPDETPIGAGINSVTASYRVLQMKNGDTVQPRFTLWLVGNEVPGKDVDPSDMTTDNYEMVYGADPCPNEKHQKASNNGEEAASIVPDPILVSAFPWIDAHLMDGGYDQVRDVYDFSTGNENALNKDAGQVLGRNGCFGVTLRMRRPDPGKGLKGIEFPDPEKPITIDVTLDVSFEGVTADNQTVKYADMTEDYQPLAWAVGKNVQNRNLIEPYSERKVTFGWMTSGVYEYSENATYKSAGTGPEGEWSSSQTGKRISLEVNGFDIDTNHNPWRTIMATSNNLYNPAAYSNFWEHPQLSFTCAQIWVVQPLNNNKTGEYILDDLGMQSGDFTWTVQDVNLQCTSVSGQTVSDKYDDHDAQTNVKNDKFTEVFHVDNPGTLNSYISYRSYKTSGYSPLTPDCMPNGKDWTVQGSGVTIASYIQQSENPELDNRMAVADELLKFDDEFFEPENTRFYVAGQMSEAADKGSVNIYFAAKPDGSGWTDDEEMKLTTPDDLVYYASLEAMPDDVVCVGVLTEYRAVINPNDAGQLHAGVFVDGHCKTTAESNNVYMTTHSSYAWRAYTVKKMVADDLGIDVSSVTDDQINAYFKEGKFPSHYAGDGNCGARYEDDNGVRTSAYPEAAGLYKQWKLHDGSENGRWTGILDYVKSYYDESGFAGGGTPASTGTGDSCLVVSHESSIIIQVEQGPGGSLTPGPVNNAAYSMDLDQRNADFVVFPTIEIPNLQLEAGQETVLKTDVLINVTIPKGLNYIDGSCVYDGTYTPPATHGMASGTVEGGEAFTEGGQYDITVSTDDAGNTVLELVIHDVEIDWSKEEYRKGVAALPPIHYSCTIGARGTDHDVKNNQQFMTPATIHTTQDHRDVTTNNKNIDSCTITVSRQSPLSILDKADQNCVDIQQRPEGDMATFSFTKTARNDAETAYVDAVIVSHVPSASNNSTFANEDARVEMTSYTLDLTTFGGMPKVYYSTTEEDRTKKDHKISDINDSTRWTEITVNEDGSVNLPEGVDITALAIIGTVPGMTTARMGATYDLINATPNDMIYDSLSMKEMEVFARSFVVSRSLSGRAWLDANKDGLYQKGERLFEGVTVTLYKKDDSGDYQLYTINRGPETAITNSNGEYSFHVLPEGTFKVVFSDDRIGADEDGLYKYELTMKDAMENGRDTYDSDAVEDPENSFMIDGITLPPTEEIVVQDFTSPHHDVGVIMKDVEVTKEWDDSDDQDGYRLTADAFKGKIKLYGNDSEISGHTPEVTVDEEDDSKYLISYKDLPWYQANDNGERAEIVYEVEETVPDHYTCEETRVEDGGTLVNKHEPGELDIPVEKVWEGTDKQKAELMPDAITIKLKADGNVIDTVDLSEDNQWKHTFTGLPEYKVGEVGHKITYTIEEVKVEGYTAGVITGSEEDGFTVTNTPYEPVEVTLEVTKELKGRDWETDDSFEFVLANTDDDPMPEAGGETVTVTKNEPTGKFGTIEFLKKGNYHYTIKETKEDLDGVRYDATEKPVEVIVTEDTATGKLKAECKYSNASSLTVTNVFTPITQQLEVTKVLEGREWTKDDSFKFTLTAKTEGAPVPEDNTVTVTKDSPTGKFSPMTFKKAGDYEYTIKEVDEGLGGVTYDVTEHTVIVHVSKDEDNQLSATVEYETDKGLIITNVYDAEGSATFEAFKQLNGRKLKEGEFNFILKDSEGEVIEKVPNDAEGKAVFTAIGYKLSEDKDKLPIQYTIEEEIPEEKLGGVSYSESVMKINVFFTDKGDGTLDVVTVYSELDNQTFVNDYASAGELPITAKKELTGRKLAAGQFSAELVDEEGKVLQTVQNDENGVFTFEPLTYTQDEFKTEEGYAESVERNYTVREVDEGKPGYVYDKTEFPIHVVLTDDQAGKISVDTSAQEMEFVFRNEYKAKGDIQIKAQKLYNGGKLEDGMFTFCLYDQDGKLIEKVKNDATGDVTFAAIAVDETVFANGETDAVKTYTVKEEKPLFPKKGVTYDSRTFTATVALHDEGDGTISSKITWSVDGKETEKAAFVNNYEESHKSSKSGRSSKTGDSANGALWALLLLMAGGALAGTVWYKRRKKV